MKKINLVILTLLIPFTSLVGQTTDLSGQELLDKTIKYHDPNNAWESFQEILFAVTVDYGNDNYLIKEIIEIDNVNDFYKSTCFQEFGTLKRGIDKGKIFVDGVDIIESRPKELDNILKRIGMVFQGAALFDSLTIAENVFLHLINIQR